MVHANTLLTFQETKRKALTLYELFSLLWYLWAKLLVLSSHRQIFHRTFHLHFFIDCHVASLHVALLYELSSHLVALAFRMKQAACRVIVKGLIGELTLYFGNLLLRGLSARDMSNHSIVIDYRFDGSHMCSIAGESQSPDCCVQMNF